MGGAAVGQVIPGNGRDNGMPDAEAPDGLGDAAGFLRVSRRGLARGHAAEGAVAAADVAQNHERGRTAAPAFPLVGALRAPADCVQRE